MRRAIRRCGWGLVLGMFTGPMSASAGLIASFGVPGATATIVEGINDKGDVAGFYGAETGPPRGFIRDADGTIVTFGAPDPSPSSVVFVGGINDAGQVSGMYDDGSGIHYHGYIRAADGSITTFTTPFSASNAFGNVYGVGGINDAGQVVGSYYRPWPDGSGSTAFIRAADGTFTTFDVPGATDVFPWGITDAGLVYGSYYGAGIGSYGFVRQGEGAAATFRLQIYPIPSGVTDAGLLFGSLPSGAGYLQSVDGTVTKFYIPGGNSEVRVAGINDSGQIAGTYFDFKTGHFEGYVATLAGLPQSDPTPLPTPEPSTFALAGVGGLGLIGYARRRRSAGGNHA